MSSPGAHPTAEFGFGDNCWQSQLSLTNASVQDFVAPRSGRGLFVNLPFFQLRLAMGQSGTVPLSVAVLLSLIASLGSALSSGRGSPVMLGQTPEPTGTIAAARGVSSLASRLSLKVWQSPDTIANFSSLLQALVPQRHVKDVGVTLERTTISLDSLLALTAFFASNNMLDNSVDSFFKWIVDQDHAGVLAQFMQIQTPTTRAFVGVLLGSAIRSRRYQMLDAILDSGIELGRKLYGIACLGKPELTRRALLNARPDDLAGSKGARLLHLFIRDKHLDLAKFLLDRGVPVDAQSGSDGSPLYDAVREFNHEGIAFLVGAGADINLHCTTGTSTEPPTPLALALSRQSVGVIQLLLASKTGMPSTIEGKPILEWASLRVRRRGVLSLLKKALALEAESPFSLGDAVDAANNGAFAFAAYVQQQPRGVTTHQMEQALEESIKEGHVTAALTLLRLGVDPNGRTLETAPLATALSKTPVRQVLVELLLDYQADLEPLAPASIAMSGSVLDRFSASGADMPRRIQVLYQAVRSDNLDAAAKIIRSGVDIDAPEPEKKTTPLRTAAFYGFTDIAVYLLSRGAAVNAATPDERRVTALQAGLAGLKPHEIGNLLLDHGADVSAAPASGVGMTALEALFCNGDWSVNDGMMALCNRLLAAGATVNRPGGQPSAVLHGIIGHQRQALLPRFLGPPHNALVTHMYIWKHFLGHALGTQCTPSQLAAISGDLESLKLLVDHNADVNEAAGHQSGRTALQGASQLRPGPAKTELISYLFCHNVDVNARPAPHRGITALQGAAISGDLILAEQRTLNSSCLHPLSAASGAPRSNFPPKLLPPLPKQEIIR